jgi:hypothetical protein
MESLAFPFRFSGGRAARVDDASDEFAAQHIAAAVLTRRQELPITPLFGSTDPEFLSFDTASFLLTATNYFPGISIDDLTQTVTGDERVSVTIQYSFT